MAVRERRYWDSNCFLGWLANEPDKVDRCRGVLKAAERGHIYIVTSSLTLAEVVKLKSKTPLPKDKEPIITNFFKHDWIVVRQLDPRTAEWARDLVWNHGIDPKDSVHVATALRAQVNQLDTFDDGLLKKNGRVGDPPLKIGRPDLPEQLELGDT